MGFDFDDLILDDFEDEEDSPKSQQSEKAQETKKKPASNTRPDGTPMRYHTLRAQKQYEKRRAFSEKNLLDEFEWHLQDGCVYCVISGGDVDQLSFLKLVLRNQALQYCLLSSWCFGIEDVQEIKSWVRKGLIKRIDFYTGEIARASYEMCTRDLSQIARSTGGRCAVFRNHSKVILAYGSQYTCAILSSANVNTNPRTENTTIICSREVADFYKDFFDGINPFNKGFEDWKKAVIE